MAKRKRETDVSTFDMTINAGHNEFGLDETEVCTRLSRLAKKWVAQREIGSHNGTKHWQIRLRTWKPMRQSAFVTLSQTEGLCGHISVTSNPTYKSKTFSYVMKADSRDPEFPDTYTDEDWSPPEPMLSHVQRFDQMEKYPWQQTLIDMSQVYDERCVDVIIDPRGNSGKSAVQDWMVWSGLGRKCPTFTEQGDMIQYLFDFKPAKCYMLNMPKAQNKNKLAGFYAGVETLKDGYMYDKRYKGRERHIEKPRVFIFTNQVPDFGLLSKDRWRVWYIRQTTMALEDKTSIFIPRQNYTAEESDRDFDRLCATYACGNG